MAVELSHFVIATAIIVVFLIAICGMLGTINGQLKDISAHTAPKTGFAVEEFAGTVTPINNVYPKTNRVSNIKSCSQGSVCKGSQAAGYLYDRSGSMCCKTV